MKYLALLLFVFCSCKTPIKEVVKYTNLQNGEVPHQLPESTFYIDGPEGQGIGFILEHKLVTCYHVLRFDKFDPDFLIFGYSDHAGLSLCQHGHTTGDLVYICTRRGVETGTLLTSNAPTKRNLLFPDYVYQGDSGSPVFCVEHESVLGCMSSILPPYYVTTENNVKMKYSCFSEMQTLTCEDIK